MRTQLSRLLFTAILGGAILGSAGHSYADEHRGDHREERREERHEEHRAEVRVEVRDHGRPR